MSGIPSSFALFLALASIACRASSAAGSGDAPRGRDGAEKIGVFAPLDSEGYAFWPEAHGGALTLLEILPHGTPVKAGDVLVRLDARAIDEELRRAELELASSRVSHGATLEKNRLEEEAARSALERARAALERSRRALEGWKTQELAFEARADELGAAYEAASVEDQVDELDQLTKMYQADELVDATEDIVIKRSQRGLALTRRSNELSRDRARFHRELELALQTEQREEEFRAQGEAVARLEAQQAIEARTRRDGELRSADALAEQEKKLERLRRDRVLFELAAWKDGVFLHGSPRDWRPGKSPARHDRGDTLPVRASVFAIAAPEPSAVALELSEADGAFLAEGARVAALPMSGEGAAATGALRVDRYARSLGTGELTFEARAELERPVSGARYGMRARVTLQEAPEGE